MEGEIGIYGITYHLILEVHYFYHLLRKHLRTFAPIVSAHPYCARKCTRHVHSRHQSLGSGRPKALGNSA